ncbi:MAG: 50S ribosomal protein L11 methyltransferase [Rhizobiaceae bacterium]
MSQTRLYFAASGARARELFSAIEQMFEDDGLPLAILEVDEARDLHEISVYSTAPDDDAVRIGSLFSPGEHVAIHRETLPDIDWVAKSLEDLPPVRAGRFLIHGAHDRAARRVSDIAVEIEAGQAFGTGHHGTTVGCLEMIADVLRRVQPKNALDLGTGSAVLAIALAKAAPIPVLATDIDPVATRVAAANAQANGVAARITTVTATGLAHPVIAAAGPFDLIVANILAGPLMRLAPAMARNIAPDGTLILSGILVRQRRAVIAAYANQHFRHIRTISRGEWVAMQLRR